MGISTIVALLPSLILYWFLFYEKKIINLFFDKKTYLIALIFIFLAILPVVIHPGGFGIKGDVTVHSAKTILGVLQSPFLFLKPVAFSEPILMIFAAIGLILAFLYRKRLFWPIFLFIYTYSAIFYLFFRYEHRFTLPLLPLLVIMAAYGFIECYQRICNKNKILSIGFVFILVIPLILSLRLGYLFYNNDSRIHARQWVEGNIPQNSKILVYARLTRLSSTKEAIQEQEKLDSGSLRKVDLAEENLIAGRSNTFHALNLYSVNNPEFYQNIKNYAEAHNYQYLLISMNDFQQNPGQWSSVMADIRTMIKFEI